MNKKLDSKVKKPIDKFYENSFGYPQLFEGYEKERAEVILSQLEGLSISSATELLDKCRTALAQVPLSNIL